MEPAGPLWKLIRRPPKKLLDEWDPELDAPIQGPLFSPLIFRVAGIAIPSVLLMIHYRRIYSYISDENVFFAITFTLSFVLGFPCGLVGLFG